MDAIRTGRDPLALQIPARWITFANGWSANNTLKTAIATVAAPVTYQLLADFTGTLGARLFNGLGPAFTLSVTTSASVGAYNVGAASQIIVNGWWSGAVAQQKFQLVATGGGETINVSPGQTGTSSLQPLDKVDSIVIPAQVNAAGTFAFGVVDMVAPSGSRFRYVRAAAAGNVALRYGEDPTTDDVVSLTVGEQFPAACSRVLAATAVGVSVSW